MLVFLDESGDTGFKFAKGSSQYFVVMLVLVSTPEMAEDLDGRMEQVRRERQWTKEFHFNETPDPVRLAFLKTLGSAPGLRFRAIVVPKGQIHSEFLRTNYEKFYNYVVRSVLDNDGGRIQEAKLFIDKRGPKTWRNGIAAYLRRQLNAPGRAKLLEVRQKDWKENSLIQVADMYCGALYRFVTRNDDRFYRLIKKQRDDVWWFR